MKNHFFAPILTAGLGLILAGRVTAQTLTTLHSFAAGSSSTLTNSDGAVPYAGLLLSGNVLYGTAEEGGAAGNGTVFRMNADGTGFTNLHDFSALLSGFTNSDGTQPEAGLILSGNTLYGTAYRGGSSGNGTVFAVNTDGTGFRNLHSFSAIPGSPPQTNSDGGLPYAGLILSGSTLYGTTTYGGTGGYGTVFAVNTDGTTFTNLHSFTGISEAPSFTNSDGARPYAGLLLSGNTLYGTAEYGGSSGEGTVFAVETDGSGFTVLHTFSGGDTDGAFPGGGLTRSGNTLYGATVNGGKFSGSGEGTVFALNTDGAGFRLLYSFSGGSDGDYPFAGVVLSGDALYGATYYGGTSFNGTLFKVNTNGTGFTSLYSFAGGSDGRNPNADLILSGNTLYGTTLQGGTSDAGTVFSLSLPPLATPAGPNSWTNSASGKWESSSNWSLGEPGPGQNLFITNAGSKTVSIDADTAVNSPNSLNISSLVLDSPSASDTNTLTITDATLVLTNGTFGIGNGRLELASGSVTAEELVVGMYAGSTGTVSVAGGILTVTSAPVLIGPAGSGRLTINGGTVTVPQLKLGGTTGTSSGVLRLGGGLLRITDRGCIFCGIPLNDGQVDGGMLDVSGANILIGEDHNALFTLNNGAAIAARMYIGFTPGFTGTYTQAGGVMIVTTNLIVGISNSSAVANLNGGALFVTNAAHTATLDVRNSTFNLNGGTLTVEALILTNAGGHFRNNGGALIAASVVLDPNLDADDDGVSNASEDVAGTDPLRPSSSFRIVGAQVEAGNQPGVRVTWTTVGGKSYVVQTRGTLTGPFGDLSPVISISGAGEGTTNYLDPGAGTNDAGYYRVRLVMPP